MITLQLRYTRPLMQQAIFNYIKRVYLKKMLGTSILALLLVAVAFSLDSPWLRAFAVVPVIALPAMLVLGYGLRIRQSLERLSLLDHGVVVLHLDETGISGESAIGTWSLKWKIFIDLWEFPTMHLLLYNEGQFITLPKDQITPEFIAYLRSKLSPSASPTVNQT